VELAFQQLVKHGRGDVSDLVLLDTATGRRRRLAGRVFWGVPRWSADGRRVRFTKRFPSRGFVEREVDVETGVIQTVKSWRSSDVVDDVLEGLRLPGYCDGAVLSPARRWLLYRHRPPSVILCVARADGSEVFALKLGFPYFLGGAYWSPCGTKLAVDVTAVDDTGAYVIDLRTGEHRRVQPEQDVPVRERATFHVSGWSPDGAWVVATKTRWHNPRTYDYEWRELWLLAADGATAKQITDDGLCHLAAIRPAGEEPAANAEHELTFAWAQRLRSAGDRPAAGEALAAQVRIDPVAGPPFVIALMVRQDGGLRYPVIADCANVPDGFAKLDAFLAENNIRPADSFTVVFPRYATDDPDEDTTVLHIAHLVLAETAARFWQFSREVPAPPAGT
jgi:hypothetical protein